MGGWVGGWEGQISPAEAETWAELGNIFYLVADIMNNPTASHITNVYKSDTIITHYQEGLKSFKSSGYC